MYENKITELLKNKEILTVSKLNEKISTSLSENLATVQVEGEISNLIIASSGHCYFSIKDSKAQISCVMFKFKAGTLSFKLHNGLKVLLIANTSLYSARGQLQLQVEYAIPAGLGQLQLRFNQLKEKLKLDGLFAEASKKPLPKLIRKIALITSSKGAALADLLHVLNNNPLLKVYLYPSLVQGEEAKKQLVSAIELANRHQTADVIILSRGGGSLEDLWSFNEESVAWAIFNSKIPVISAVGHEIDFTIADFVADHRAATPSTAAQMVSGDFVQSVNRLKQFNSLLARLMMDFLAKAQQRVDLAKRQLLDPSSKLKQQSKELIILKNNLSNCIKKIISIKKLEISNQAKLLNSLSPLNILARGYSIVKRNHKIINSIEQINTGDTLKITTYSGHINATVNSIVRE